MYACTLFTFQKNYRPVGALGTAGAMAALIDVRAIGAGGACGGAGGPEEQERQKKLLLLQAQRAKLLATQQVSERAKTKIAI